MFPKKYRLPSTHVGSVLHGGKRKTVPGCTICYHQSEDIPNRFAIVVSTAVAKRAVKRNMIRRQIREAVSLFMMKNSVPYDVVFVVRKDCAGKTKQEIRKMTHEALNTLL